MASGYDLSSRVPFRLMKGRLGVYEKRPFDPIGVTAEQMERQERIGELMSLIRSMNLQLDDHTIQQIEELLAVDDVEEIKVELNKLDPNLSGIYHLATLARQAGGNT